MGQSTGAKILIYCTYLQACKVTKKFTMIWPLDTDAGLDV
jgi:hypothetical protein